MIKKTPSFGTPAKKGQAKELLKASAERQAERMKAFAEGQPAVEEGEYDGLLAAFADAREGRAGQLAVDEKSLPAANTDKIKTKIFITGERIGKIKSVAKRLFWMPIDFL